MAIHDSQSVTAKVTITRKSVVIETMRTAGVFKGSFEDVLGKPIVEMLDEVFVSVSDEIVRQQSELCPDHPIAFFLATGTVFKNNPAFVALCRALPAC